MAGFLLGRNITTLPMATRSLDTKFSVERQQQVLHYNRTFGDEPSTESDRAWKEVFPAHGGLFPIVSTPSQRVTLTVFHQLHCLDGIRQNYWHLYRTLQPNTKEHQKRANMHISHAHVRHCIDLLRQTLMCNADTTLEMKKSGENGVHGFGTLRHCVDWNNLIAEVAQKQMRGGKDGVV